MIVGMELPQQIPFNGDRVTIEGMNRVCFFFGPNGSGKTSISQLIAAEATKDDSSVLKWDSGTPIKTFVYNKHFVKANFSDDSSVPGVFTMGEDAVNAQGRIEQLKANLEKERTRKSKAVGNLDDASRDLGKMDDSIRDVCWSVRSEMPEALKHIWTGTGRKEPFRDTLLTKIDNLDGTEEKPDLDDLERRVGVVFDNNAVAVPPIPAIDLGKLASLESEPILEKKIVGKEDLPIGALIKRLGNSDWVAQGRGYATEGDTCPFCQQPTITSKLKAELDEFFDETYESDKAELARVSNLYRTISDDLVTSLDQVLKSYADFLDSAALEAKIAELKTIIRTNIGLIAKKMDEPSIAVSLDSVSEIISAISGLLKDASNAIARHNEMISHRSKEQARIIEELWLYAAMVAKPLISTYVTNKKDIGKKIAGLNKKITEHDGNISKMTDDLEQAEESLTNVKKTAEVINSLLARFGFTNFRLTVTDDNKYRIERMDGTLVSDTLSEGESSFLTFLYFYQLMSGSLDATGTTDKRVVVIDDPVSSMDADVLFVASSLVRQLAKEARDGTGNTEQLIVLTHNITFHHEVTYIRNGEGNSRTTYFVIQKMDNYSTIATCDEHAISSTYDLLWKDICRSDCNPVTAQNVARRITETFFKFVGGPDLDGIVARMSSPDREIARSYVAWANSGSHSPLDDETFFNTSESIEVYRRVLRTIFDEAGYADHYDKMIAKFSTNTYPGIA